MAVNLKFLPESATSVDETALTELDFGAVFRGYSKTMGLKVGNTGDSIAESVTLKVEGSDESAGWKTISVDNGTTWKAESQIPNIPATDGISGAIKIKSEVPANAVTGLHTSSLRVEYIYI